jgi:ribosomal protein S18 acetylase RimI-like enzyme
MRDPLKRIWRCSRTPDAGSDKFPSLYGRKDYQQDVSRDELGSFLSQLTDEKNFFRVSSSDLLSSSEIVIVEKVDGLIAGIAGVRRHRGVPVFFIVIKAEFQGRGIGDKLMCRLLEIVKTQYNFLLLTVLKENKSAISLFQKYGYRTIGEKHGSYYMVFPINGKGKFFAKMLKTLFPIISVSL